MTVTNAIVIAVFMMVFVFFVLAILCGLIKLMSYALTYINITVTDKQPIKTVVATPTEPDENSAFGGEIILQDVDEPTAAMIMAIISDESGIPLSNLCFKSIKAVSKTLA